MEKTALIFKKTIFLFMVLFLVFVVANFAKASEIEKDYDAEISKECSLRNCTIPIPTLDKPKDENVYFDEKFYLTGLTWNDTEIDIYIDEKYRGSAVVVNDENTNTANFYYLIEDKTLFEGDHNWEVVAWSKNRRDRSFVSSYNNFKVELKQASSVKPVLDNKNLEPINQEQNNIPKDESKDVDSSETSSTNEKEANVNIIADEVPGKVVVDTSTSSSINVNIIESEEINQNISATSEENIVENTDTEVMQAATPNEEDKGIIENDLDLSNNQIRNKKLGIFLLFVLVVVVIFSTLATRKRKE